MSRQLSNRETHLKYKGGIKMKSPDLRKLVNVWDSENRMWVYFKPGTDTDKALENLRELLKLNRNEVKLTEIKGLKKKGLYLVNGKEVNTNVPKWGRPEELTNREYKALRNFMKAEASNERN